MNVLGYEVTEKTEDIAGENVVWACLTVGTSYLEVPVHSAETEEEKATIVENAIFAELQRPAMSALMTKTSHSDDVYSNKELVRQDRPLVKVTLTPEEEALIPEGAKDVIIGRYTGYRPPYNGSGLSIYDQRLPPEDLLTQLGLTTKDFKAGLHSWYAIKKDDASGDIFYKIVEEYHSSHGGPEMPKNSMVIWTAKIYKPNGEVDSHVDFFIAASRESMGQWCEQTGNAFPIPDDETGTPWCYGIVWNTETQQVVTVKGYIPRDD